MPIKFKCPHCQRGLSVKDHLAGKKATCPACKKVVQIPAPVAAPAPAEIDAEAVAAAVLTEKPPAAQTETKRAETRTVDFNCLYCEAELHLSAELAGKQTPCPECRRIIKVPQLVKDEPIDWRKPGAGLPSGARREEQPAPDGAWGSTSAAAVSRQTLLDADLLPAERARATLRQWAFRGTAAAGLLLLLGVGGVLGWNYFFGGRGERALAQALAYTAGDAAKKLGPEGVAAVHLAAGEFRARSGAGAAEALKEYLKGLAALAPGGPKADREALLADLAVAVVDLGGTDDEAKTGKKLKWNAAADAARKVLQAMKVAEARHEALRAVGHKLAEKKQGSAALVVAAQLGAVPRPDGEPAVANDVAEGYGIVGLELFRTGDKEGAAQAVEQARPLFVAVAAAEGEEPKPPPGAPSVVALCTALGVKPPDAALGPEETAAGRAEGLALANNDRAAREEAQRAGATRLRAYAGIAAATQSAADVTAALDLAKGDASPWVVWRLVRLGARAGTAEADLLKAASAVRDPAARGQVQLEVVRAKLAQSKGAADWAAADAVEKTTLAHSMALAAVARHNARHDSGTLSVVNSWEETQKPFGLAGVALGLQGD